MNTVAHVSFAGGGLFVPARDPYERELLVEHVVERARRAGAVVVAVHGRAWSVRLTPDTFTGSCTRCGRVLQATWYATAPGAASYCLPCAFGTPGTTGAVATEAPALPSRVRNRHAGATPRESVLAVVQRWTGVALGRTAA